jgi:hypothetical protein
MLGRYRSLGVAAALVAAIAATSCGDSGDDAPAPRPAETRGGADELVTGPLCHALPQGDDPGAPASLTDDTADVALTWIPVITTFEAGIRAAGLDDELRAADGVTILAPTDDAFAAAFSRGKLDALLLSRHRELRDLLEAHMIDGSHSLSELLEAGSVTTRSGDTLAVAEAAGMARFDDRAETVCADYEASNARIHVIGGVLD